MKNRLIKTELNGVYEINGKSFFDERGSFRNLFRRQDEEFRDLWGKRKIEQINLSFSKEKGSLRGLHFQINPHSEAKIIQCISGKVWDVAVDLRKNSSTFKNWTAVELSGEKDNAIFIPEGCAHGFQTLTSNCELLYIHSNDWVSSSEIGIRYNDSAIGVTWPIKCTELSDRDRNLPFLESIDL